MWQITKKFSQILLIGIVFCFIAPCLGQNQRILFKSKEIHAPLVQSFATLSQSPSFKNRHFALITTDNTKTLHDLKSVGVLISDYIPEDAYLAIIPSVSLSTVALKIGSENIYFINPDWKIDSALIPYSLNDSVQIEVSCFEESISDLIEFQILTGNILQNAEKTLFSNQFSGSILKKDLLQLAAFPFIKFIGIKSKSAQDLNYSARIKHGSNMLSSAYASGLNFNGSGIRIIISDSSVPGNHIDLKNRVDSTHFSDPFIGVHTTQVAGTLVGAGNLDPNEKGHAWGATVYSYEGILGVHAFPSAYTVDSVVITSISQGGCCNSGYNQQAQIVDQSIINHSSLLQVFAAGNDGQIDNGHVSGAGWGTISSNYQGGKNNLVVGAINANDYIENYSSKGPLPDGRIKPELVAVGVVSTTLPSNQYFEASGTSLACPGVTGTLAQLYEAYRSLHNQEYPNSALMKAILLNTAEDIGNPGPDYTMGYGRINGRKAYESLLNQTYFSGAVSTGQTSQFTLTAPTGATGLKVLLYWHDAVGSTMAAQALVNDLDLTIIDPSGTTWNPWILNPNQANSNATRGIDHINNSEQITYSSLIAGDYTINIHAFDINTTSNQEFYIAYEFEFPSITLTHPVGGEAFSPGSDVNIRWETEALHPSTTTTIEYSIDNGQNWTSIGTSSNYFNSLNWSAPWVINGNYQIRASSSSYSDLSDSSFSIMKTPQNLNFDMVCVDQVTMSWDATWNATSYDVYMLGEKYMEFQGTTDATTFTFTGVNTNQDNWFSVRAKGINNAIGLRAVAIKQAAGTIDCPLSIDKHAEKTDIQVFPNPANEFTYVKLPSPVKVSIVLFDCTGRIVKSYSSSPTENQFIDLSNIPDGFYLLQVDDQFTTLVKTKND